MGTEEEAEQYKNQGNEFFKNNSYEKSIEFYTKAIETNINSKKVAIFYSNRAFAHIKMENYGLAISDADEAIKIDAEYVKSYYRKADASIALGQYKVAKKYLKMLVDGLKIKDQDAQEKYKFVDKIIKEKAFLEAIYVADNKLEFDLQSMQVEESYNGPSFSDDKPITSEWVQSLIEFFKSQKKLHKKYAIMLIQKAESILKSLNSLVEVDVSRNSKITVCGDTHGQFYDLANIFTLNGFPSEENPYLFNGDFVDRGSFSVEVILTLLAWKVQNPNCMHLTRGNHESRNMTKLYGFEGEVNHKYDKNVYELFLQCFQALPLAFVLQNKVMVCHGGLFKQDGVTLNDIKKTERFKEIPDDGIMCDLLWADPAKTPGRTPSKRGISIGFGPDITKKFLQENNLQLLVRSHEMKDQGYEEDHDGKCITIFSAPNYCDQMKNLGAYIIFQGDDMKPQYKQFSCVDHPKIPAMAYANKFMQY